jgi:energy-coupling factor transporter ATP-binding protein EcfA2
MADERNPPRPPEELVKACRDRECVLYGGAGLSAWAGFPVWKSFVRRLLDWAVKSQKVEPEFAKSMRAAIQQGDVDAVADNVVNAVLGREPEALHAYLRGLFLREKPLPSVHRILQGIPFSAVLTTNFDNLFERAYGDAPVFTPIQTEPLLDAIAKRRFFLLKLYGTLDQPESVMVAPAQYEEAISGNAAFAQCMETLFFSRTLLFVGASLEGIEAYLRGIAFPTGMRRTHYALVAVKGMAWESKAHLLRRRYGIQVLPYRPTKGVPEVPAFLAELRDLAEPVRTAAASGSTSTTVLPSEDGPGQLKRMLIENIGAFEQLELTFHPRWNILLGDNGVGKSTILKALAVAMVGRDAEPFAWHLLRLPGTATELPSPGTITLQTERGTYKTILQSRPDQKVEIQSIPGRPLEAEGWLAVGFPPLRTMSWERPRAQETLVRARPTPNDLLPLVQGDPDPRLNQLKQWIVNLDYWIKDARSRTGNGGLYEKLLQEFFRVVGELTEGVKIQFVEVRPQTFEIIVHTDDGDIPLEAVSQGMISLLGWVGVLLQRFYEVYGDEDGDADPLQRYALVLMDEIDAHLHPTWQRTLVPKLEKIFPNAQFIATTHSPLVVAGMPPEQVFRFVRDEDGKVARLPVDADMTVGRADQILTGDLFGLATTLDPETEKAMCRYGELLGKSLRSEDEEREFQRLRAVLHTRIPVSGETPVERRAQDLLRALLRSQAGDLFPEAQKDLLNMARKLFQSLQKEQRNAL